MDSSRWQQVEALYHEALEQDSGARSAFLARACAEDEELFREVEVLLSYERRAEAFIEKPAFEMTARALAADPREAITSIGPREIGHYKLVSLLGTGGMGEVYLALDTRLSRKVAIKLLPLEFAADSERVRRFQQEARAVSALNHPNIVTVFEIGENDGRHYIVSEFVDGQTLRQRMAETPSQMLRPAEALEIAAQTASALQTAHDAGIIHRDVKPENVMVRKDGLVKVLDFGLAKIASLQAEQQPPILDRISTNSGIVMGTVTYMSPEQLRGERVDHRTDIFSLGVILYEMFAGTRPFEAPTASDVIVAVLTKDPEPLDQIARNAPAQLQAMVSRCLEKRPEQRFQSASDLGFALRALNTPKSAPASAETDSKQASTVNRIRPSLLDRVRQTRLGPILIAAAAVLLAIVLVLTITRLLEQPPEKVAATFSINLPENWRFRWFDSPAVSPNGKHIVFGAVPISEQTGRTVFLWVRNLDSNNAKTLPGTEGGISPFWSPDSRFIAFWANGKLKKIDLTGSAVTICETPATLSCTWGTQGVILFTQDHRLHQVPANGGRAEALGPFADGETGQSDPRFLPDGKLFLYYSHNRDKKNDGIYVASIDSRMRRKFVLGGEALTAAYVVPGYLLFNKGEMLMAQSFDLSRLELTGEPVLVAEQTASYASGKPDGPLAAFSVSENGVLTWKLKTEETVGTQLTWVDRSGRRLGTIGETAGFSGPAFSPDQKRLAIARLDPSTKGRDLWIMEMFGGAGSRLTFDAADDLNPVWTPDGKSIIFTSAQRGKRDIYRRPADGSGESELLLESNSDKNVEDLSPDGRFLIFNSRTNEERGPDLSLLTLTGERKVTSLVATQFREDQAQFSPDGRWIAYRSEEVGSSEVFVRGFSREGVLTSGKWRVSENGGCQPRWRGDGKELYYIKGNHVVAVDIRAEGSSLSAGAPRQLFDVNVEPEERRNRFVVTRDGQRFLVVALTEATGGSTVSVRVNWLAPLER